MPTIGERPKTASVRFEDHDDRLLLQGKILSREYEGRAVHVLVMIDEFEWNSRRPV